MNNKDSEFNDLFYSDKIRREFQCSIYFIKEHFYDYCKRLTDGRRKQIR